MVDVGRLFCCPLRLLLFSRCFLSAFVCLAHTFVLFIVLLCPPSHSREQRSRNYFDDQLATHTNFHSWKQFRPPRFVMGVAPHHGFNASLKRYPAHLPYVPRAQTGQIELFLFSFVRCFFHRTARAQRKETSKSGRGSVSSVVATVKRMLFHMVV